MDDSLIYISAFVCIAILLFAIFAINAFGADLPIVGQGFSLGLISSTTSTVQDYASKELASGKVFISKSVLDNLLLQNAKLVANCSYSNSPEFQLVRESIR